MTDPFAASLDAIYTVLGVEATLSLMTETITAIDKTSGIELSPGGEGLLQTLAPAAAIRVADLTANGLVADDLVGETITLNSVSWKIINHQSKPTPRGEAAGELYLILRKV